MKDKLYKNNHKGIYYKAKNFSIAATCFIFLAVAIIVPTYITTQAKVSNTKAEVVEKDETAKKESFILHY